MITIPTETNVMNTQAQLILFFSLAIIFNVIELMPLTVTLIAILPWLIFTHNHHFYQLLKRLKWLFIFMLIIYMFNTPGEYVLDWPFLFQPTYEGIRMGLAQVFRVILIIAMLSIINQQNTKQALVSGLYTLIKPLQLVGIKVDRFAVRLWLTLNYVDSSEGQMKITSLSHLFDAIHQALNEDNHPTVIVTIKQEAYRYTDYFLITVVSILFAYVIFQA